MNSGDEVLMWLVLAFCAGLIAFAGFALYKGEQHRDWLLQQCLSDGHKQYQCEGWLNSGTVVPVPVIIPR